MADPAEQKKTQLANIERDTGRTVAEWAKLVDDAGLIKHGQIVARLKSDHGFSHGNANALAHAVRERAAGGPQSATELLDAQYAGAKAALRPIYDEIVVAARGLGDDVEVLVNKTGVSLRRSKQFAVVEAPSTTRVRLGLVLKGRPPTDRLTAVRSMCTHAVDVTDVDDVDDELLDWLSDAYRAAGTPA
jgi:hypothetical protein